MKRLLGCAITSVLVLVTSVALAKPPMTISDCGTVITEPGKYRLTHDLFCLPDQQGIQIFASDVTLDLRGHTITCDASGEELVGAVWIGNIFDPALVVEDVWVKNGTVSGCDDGVIFFYGQSGKATKMTLADNVGGGITVFEATDTLIKNNVGFGNAQAISIYFGVGTKIKGNVLNDNIDVAIALEPGIDSLVACNTSQRDAFGVRIGPLSSGNVVRGNFVSNTAEVGIGIYGIGFPEHISAPMPEGNLVTKNIVLGTGGADLAEAMLQPTGGIFTLPECLNTWNKNQYHTSLGPVDCIAPPVELDDDDVCALDDDDSDSDSD